MLDKKVAAAVVIAVLATARGTFAAPPDYLDPLSRLKSRLDDLSPYPGPRLNAPGPTYPSRPNATNRLEDAAKDVLEIKAEHTLTGIPAAKPLQKAYDAYGWLDPSAGDAICSAAALAFRGASPYRSQCAAVVDAVGPETASTLADSERADTARARKHAHKMDQRLEQLETEYYLDSPYSEAPIWPFGHLRTEQRSREFLGARQDELRRSRDRRIERDRRALDTYRDAAQVNEDLLNDINRRLADPATDPSQRSDLSFGSELLRRNQQYYREQGLVPLTPRNGYVAPAPLPVFQPRQPPVILAPSDPPPPQKGCRAQYCRPD